MSQCVHFTGINGRRKRWQDKRERMRTRLANMRAAKARKRTSLIASGWTPEPKMERWHPLELGVRETGKPDTAAWVPLKSIRDTARRIGIVLKHCA
jgi:hypothetical protein